MCQRDQTGLERGLSRGGHKTSALDLETGPRFGIRESKLNAVLHLLLGMYHCSETALRENESLII